MIVFTFPGQGSQRPAMGEPWTATPSWAVVDEVAEATGRDLAALLLRTEADELTATRNAQLATFAVSLVALDATRRAGVDAAMVAGHSLGEYTALVAAGVLSPADGARLVAARGDAMQAAADARPGTMAAVLGATAEDVAGACAATGADVWLANDNAPGQAVVAGDPAAIDAAGDAFREVGAKKVVALPVGGAFHTPFMAPAAEQLGSALAAASWQPGTIPVVANVDAARHEPGGADWSELLARQLTSPVRWREGLVALAAAGATALVEIGPGGVLTGLAKRTVPDLARTSVASPDDLAAALAALGS
ncbi:MAG: ACP S-malonyltransferase [Acidimicrobiales bacterium]